MSFRSRLRPSPLRRDNGPAAGNDLAISAPRLLGRLYPELAAQDAHACLVLPERISEAPLTGIQMHQGAVSLLSQRVERQEPDGSLNGRFRRAGLGLMGHQPAQHVDGNFPKARSLSTKPLLEEVLADIETIQEISDVESGGQLEVFGAFSRGQPFKLGDVDVDCRPTETDSIGFDHHDSRT